MKLLITRIPGLSIKPYQDIVIYDSEGILSYENKREILKYELQEEQIKKIEVLISCLDFENMEKIIKKSGRSFDTSRYKYKVEHNDGTGFFVEGPVFSFGRGHHLYKSVILHFEAIYNYFISLIDEHRCS